MDMCDITVTHEMQNKKCNVLNQQIVKFHHHRQFVNHKLFAINTVFFTNTLRDWFIIHVLE